jgi:hypothetical protein
MVISISFRGSSDRLSGVIFNTDSKKFSTFIIKGGDWTVEKKVTVFRGTREMVFPREKFKIPSDMHIDERGLYMVEDRVRTLRKLGFKEDESNIDFGIENLHYTKMDIQWP